MSKETESFLVELAGRFLGAAPVAPLEWLFDEGLHTSAHQELERLGLLERMLGTSHGFAWRLTSTGLTDVVARRQTA